jgi:hypothetical protein|eukprot:COSAG01_NODE_6556_length_3610_cov_26.538023_3_plen_151_part_00
MALLCCLFRSSSQVRLHVTRRCLVMAGSLYTELYLGPGSAMLVSRIVLAQLYDCISAVPTLGQRAGAWLVYGSHGISSAWRAAIESAWWASGGGDAVVWVRRCYMGASGECASRSVTCDPAHHALLRVFARSAWADRRSPIHVGCGLSWL